MLFRPRPAKEPAATIDRVAIVSWNIHEGGGNVRDLIRRLRAGEFTGGAPISEFVLLLQEVTRRSGEVPSHTPLHSPVPRRIAPRASSPDTTDIQRFADDGFAVLYAPSMRNGDGHIREDGGAEDRGNAIVSTLPLEEPRVIELPLERQRRVPVAAMISGHNTRGSAWRLEVVDVHLDTSIALFHGGPFAARRRQTRALLDAVRTLTQEGYATGTTVVGGDFNTWSRRDTAALRLLTDALPDTPTAETAPTWRGPFGVRARLDHILVDGAPSRIHITRLPSRFDSDHYPLLAILDFGLK